MKNPKRFEFTEVQLNRIADAAVALATMVHEQGRPVAMNIDSYAQYVVGGVQPVTSVAFNEWMARANRPAYEDIPERFTADVEAIAKNDAESAVVLAHFTDELQEALLSDEATSILPCTLAEFGMGSDHFDGVLGGNIYIVFPLPSVADLTILDL